MVLLNSFHRRLTFLQEDVEAVGSRVNPMNKHKPHQLIFIGKGFVMSKSKSIQVSTFLSHEIIERKIYMIRGKKVMLDRDLSSLYDVATKTLTRAVKRNLNRFPGDFMIQLTQVLGITTTTTNPVNSVVADVFRLTPLHRSR